jgi:TnpA family transposase
LIDGLLHNDVVKSDIHSTDAFGYSEVIFATSNLVGVAYAPRFKNLKRQIFRSRQSVDRSSWKIQPRGYVDEDHIIQFLDDIPMTASVPRQAARRARLGFCCF